MSGDVSAFLEEWMADFAAAIPEDNDTARAMKEFFARDTTHKPEKVDGFSSVYKYSAVVFSEGTLVLGAPEYVLGGQYGTVRDRVEAYLALGYRVLVMAAAAEDPQGAALTGPLKALALILLRNPVREGAMETFRYFRQQQVRIRVISGDHPRTAAEAAREAGIEGADRYVDVTGLSDEELKEAADSYTVFGRVTPARKKQLIHYMKDRKSTRLNSSHRIASRMPSSA